METADWRGQWTIHYERLDGTTAEGLLILGSDCRVSGGDALCRYSGHYTVRDNTLLCDGVEMTSDSGLRVTPWGEGAATSQVVLWGRKAGARIMGMMMNLGNPHLRFHMTRRER
jgi:hypothetical protein